MSILQNQQDLTKASAAAKSLVDEVRDTYGRMLAAFVGGAKFFWQNPDGLSPEQIAEALGDSGVEVFTLHGQLGQLIGTVNQEAVLEVASVVGTFQYNEDGTVTVLSVNNGDS